VEGQVLLAQATRNGWVESVHAGHAVLIDPDGSVVRAWGRPQDPTLPRSSNKPLQATGMVAAGLGLVGAQLAIAAASHNGEQFHLDTVRAILAEGGLSEDDLANVKALPTGAAAQAAWLRAGGGPTSVTQNCSGKHAAMLATCRINGWSIDDYLDQHHPVQAAITNGVGALGAVVHHVGIDGCGAPTHAFSLHDLAAGFARLASPDSAVARAMTTHPELVGGPARDVTLWMRAVPTLVAKEGASGVMAAGLADGRAVAFKVADGSDSCRQAVVAEALRASGLDIGTDATSTADAVAVPVLGHGRPVGRLDAIEWTRCSS